MSVFEALPWGYHVMLLLSTASGARRVLCHYHRGPDVHIMCQQVNGHDCTIIPVDLSLLIYSHLLSVYKN